MVAAELRRVLLPAYPSCPAFAGVCSTMRDAPAAGHYPRGYAGARGQLGDIELIVVVPEPGDPKVGKGRPIGDPSAIVDAVAANTQEAFWSGSSVFHSKVRELLQYCWPDLPSFDDRMRRTWITEAVLCSAAKSAGPVPRASERECATRYLAKQLELLPDAFVIALGGKAKRRLRYAGRPPNVVAFAAGLPGASSKRATPSWQAAGRAFQAHRDVHASHSRASHGR